MVGVDVRHGDQVEVALVDRKGLDPPAHGRRGRRRAGVDQDPVRMVRRPVLDPQRVALLGREQLDREGLVGHRPPPAASPDPGAGKSPVRVAIGRQGEGHDLAVGEQPTSDLTEEVAEGRIAAGVDLAQRLDQRRRNAGGVAAGDGCDRPDHERRLGHPEPGHERLVLQLGDGGVAAEQEHDRVVAGRAQDVVLVDLGRRDPLVLLDLERAQAGHVVDGAVRQQHEERWGMRTDVGRPVRPRPDPCRRAACREGERRFDLCGAAGDGPVHPGARREHRAGQAGQDVPCADRVGVDGERATRPADPLGIRDVPLDDPAHGPEPRWADDAGMTLGVHRMVLGRAPPVQEGLTGVGTQRWRRDRHRQLVHVLQGEHGVGIGSHDLDPFGGRGELLEGRMVPEQLVVEQGALVREAEQEAHRALRVERRAVGVRVERGGGEIGGDLRDERLDPVEVERDRLGALEERPARPAVLGVIVEDRGAEPAPPAELGEPGPQRGLDRELDPVAARRRRGDGRPQQGRLEHAVAVGDDHPRPELAFRPGLEMKAMARAGACRRKQDVAGRRPTRAAQLREDHRQAVLAPVAREQLLGERLAGPDAGRLGPDPGVDAVGRVRREAATLGAATEPWAAADVGLEPAGLCHARLLAVRLDDGIRHRRDGLGTRIGHREPALVAGGHLESRPLVAGGQVEIRPLVVETEAHPDRLGHRQRPGAQPSLAQDGRRASAEAREPGRFERSGVREQHPAAGGAHDRAQRDVERVVPGEPLHQGIQPGIDLRRRDVDRRQPPRPHPQSQRADDRGDFEIGAAREPAEGHHAARVHAVAKRRQPGDHLRQRAGHQDQLGAQLALQVHDAVAVRGPRFGVDRRRDRPRRWVVEQADAERPRPHRPRAEPLGCDARRDADPRQEQLVEEPAERSQPVGERDDRQTRLGGAGPHGQRRLPRVHRGCGGLARSRRRPACRRRIKDPPDGPRHRFTGIEDPGQGLGVARSLHDRLESRARAGRRQCHAERPQRTPEVRLVELHAPRSQIQGVCHSSDLPRDHVPVGRRAGVGRHHRACSGNGHAGSARSAPST